ncbi:MAG: cytochrome c [Nitrospira sp.]|nr:cytochrome c [Nitrospira sp.]
MKRNFCIVAITLWVVTLSMGGWFFIKGVTETGSDGRVEILLAAVERDQILAEMRLLLKAVDGIIRGLGEPNPDPTQMEATARAVGMNMAADVEPTIMAKLPLPFKQMGMSIHKDMDALADAIARHETPQQILQRLSSMTARCTACHDMYRFAADQEGAAVRHKQ